MLRDLYIYLFVLIKKWYLYLGVIPVFYSRLDFNFGIKLPEIDKEYSNYIFIIAFLIASFNAWRELNTKLKNEVDYSISCKVKEINDDLDDNIEKAHLEINKVNEEIKKIEESNKRRIIKYPIIQNVFSPTKENLGERKKELYSYIEYLEKIKEDYKYWKKIIFYIENIGSKFDKKINVKLVNKKGKVLGSSDEDLIYRLRHIDDYPEDKSFLSIPDIGSLYNKTDEIPYRKKIDNDTFELRELHVNDSVEIFYIDEGLIIGEGEFEFKFEIRSELTKKPIVKKIKLKN